ncbi:MAG: hypothetical protein K1X47_15530 [Cyclobacteriaceae bacterium]|nr:hypothetical protein [Cyclobacteriaceae bacterium]
MAKLKNIIKQLSEKDYKLIYESLMESNAEKSAYVLKALRERQLSDSKILVELDVNPNAYYTLRSRLNQKIEEHLVQQMESPRTDLLRKVANLNEVLFTQRKTISIATLKKLERELIDYDLAHELTIIYKTLKKMHLHTAEHFQYSQAYNRHVAYMLAIDKAEDLLAEYFKRYGSYYLTGDHTQRMSLNLLLKEMHNVSNLYNSHRLYVYLSCMNIFHRLFVEKEESLEPDAESFEDIFDKVEKIFKTFNLDPLYYHLNLVFEYLRMEYYNHYRVYRESEKYYEEVNDASSNLLVNYTHFTFPSQFLVSKLQRALRRASEHELLAEDESLFAEFEPDIQDVPRHVIYVVYRSLTYFYAGKINQSAKLLQDLLSTVGLKQFPFAQLEVKGLLAFQYCLINEFDLFQQLNGSIQRQARQFEKDECENVILLMKMLRLALSESGADKEKKLMTIVNRLKTTTVNYFSPTGMIRMDDDLVKRLIKLKSEGES